VTPLEPTVSVAALAGVAAILGATLGSFLNVVIARVPLGLSVVSPRSRCPRCEAPIAWYDNVPVLSWLVLRARCRSCGAPIAWRYPLVELLGAGAAAASVLRHGATLAAAFELAFVLLLVALAFVDLDTWLLPHALTWPVIALGVAAAALGAGAAGSLRASLAGAAAGWAAFAALSVAASRLLRKEALGFGDVWLLAGLGAFLGLPALLPVVLLASLQGSVVGLVLLAAGKGEPGPAEPPAPSPAAPPGAAAPGEPPAPPAAADAPIASAPPAPAEAPEEPEWIPPRHAVPFGPFLALAALEWLYGAPLLAELVPALGVFLEG
jgi:leader peptidase (prepilin peptidase)/N-methyltransferase